MRFIENGKVRQDGASFFMKTTTSIYFSNFFALINTLRASSESYVIINSAFLSVTVFEKVAVALLTFLLVVVVSFRCFFVGNFKKSCE